MHSAKLVSSLFKRRAPSKSAAALLKIIAKCREILVLFHKTIREKISRERTTIGRNGLLIFHDSMRHSRKRRLSARSSEVFSRHVLVFGISLEKVPLFTITGNNTRSSSFRLGPLLRQLTGSRGQPTPSNWIDLPQSTSGVIPELSDGIQAAFSVS